MAYVHEPGSAGCLPALHCHWHNVDEPELGYRVCPECFHVFATARELRTKYRRGLLAVYLAELARGKWRSTTMDGLIVGEVMRIPGKLRTLAHLPRVLAIRARDIHFCPECSHDF